LIFSLFFRGNNGDDDIEDLAPDNMDEIGFFDFFDHFDPGRILVVMGGEILQPPAPPRFIDGNLYLPVNFLQQYVDRYIFWEPTGSAGPRLTISSFDEIERFVPNSQTYTVNWIERPLAVPIRQIGDMAYMAAEMVMARYPLQLDFQDEYNILIVDFDSEQQLIYRVVFEDEPDYTEFDGAELYEEQDDRWLPLRFGASTRYPIKARLEQGEQVVFIANHGEFYYVRKSNGLMGFANADNLVFDDYIAAVAQIEARRPITRPGFSGSINMVWHLMENHVAAANEGAWYHPMGVNVISPTWLRFCRASYDGTIISLANTHYVNWAHSHGMEVWPTITDMFFGENFSNEAARLILLDAAIRDYIISQIMDIVARYNLDGINVNYEQVFSPEGAHYIQFLRELAVPMRQAGAVLSATVFAPIPGNLWWNYPEIGKTVDFITMMTYDEHYGSSAVAGSVASFPWVQEAVETLLTMVPAEQIVMGMPTSARLWTEEFSLETGEWELISWDEHLSPHHRTRAMGMNFARDYILALGASFEWDYITRQYYAVHYFNHQGAERRHRMWLNDLRSVEEKLTLYTRHNLAGITWWQKGLENPALWGFVDGILN
jgi:spore germination protein YaaH